MLHCRTIRPVGRGGENYPLVWCGSTWAAPRLRAGDGTLQKFHPDKKTDFRTGSPKCEETMEEQ